MSVSIFRYVRWKAWYQMELVGLNDNFVAFLVFIPASAVQFALLLTAVLNVVESTSQHPVDYHETMDNIFRYPCNCI